MTHHKLVIAEKPSVAQSIAAVLGATKRNDGYLSGNGYLVSWCFGHLAELASADVYDEKYAKWRYDDLPILPASWRFTLKADKAKQFELLRDLMRREDVSEVVNACDAGREGELIFRTVYYMAGCTKTMKRLWISSMEDEAIRKGFADLRPGREYDGLHQSALCRARADWLVGINATRLFSVLYHRTLNVGRVMTPTLALIVQREAEIGAFRPEAFYAVNLRCGDFAAVSEKFKEKAEADALAAACARESLVWTAHALRLGVCWADAWEETPEWAHPLRDALESSWTSGNAPETMLARSASWERRARLAEAKTRAEELSVRLVGPLGACFLPAFLALGIAPLLATLTGGLDM